MIFRTAPFGLLLASAVSAAFHGEHNRKLQDSCTVDHNAIQSGPEIPIRVDALPADGEGLFDITFYGPPYAPPGQNLTVPGWCIDYSRGISAGTYDVDVFSTYDDDFHSDAVDKPENIQKLTWLLNHYTPGDTFDDGEGCNGEITWKEYQGALWTIIDNNNGTGYVEREECIVAGLAEAAEDYDPDCLDENEDLAVMLIVDDEDENILNQVVIAEVPLVGTGICSCPQEARGASGFGDPHLKTWTGEKYDFHGICDLVLLQNHDFAHGLGMDIHMRTAKTKQWSYIASAVLRIGDDTLEIQGHDNKYWLNRVEGAPLEEGLSGFPIASHHVNSKQHEFIVDLGADSGSISFKTYKDMVRIDVNAAHGKDFVGSLGMMGSYGQGNKVARDKTTIIEDPIAFGLEWQVLADEPMLFHNVQGPQAPEKCSLPSTMDQRRRLRESSISLEDAELACARVDVSERDQCIFDVMATNDKELAGAY